MKSINWKIFFILLGLSTLSVLAVFPYVLTLQSEILKQTNIPISSIILVQLLQSVLLFSIAIFIGLKLARIVNFNLPVLEAFVAHKDYIKEFKSNIFLSVILGVVTAISIYAIDHIFAIQGSSVTTSQSYAPIWQKLLASFYGGITEEILMRLFLMTLFVWIGMKLTKQVKASKIIIVISILIAAIIFGLGHLPITASLTKITPIVVVRAIVLNGIGGVVFGWLYWKKGLESAMISHFTADIFLLTILPLMIK